MIRSFFSVLAVGVFTLALAPTGCKQTGVGDPCVPEQEYNTDFPGFDAQEVNVESKSFQCQTRLCLVNHFQGRVSCPYGQDAQGKAPTGASGPCTVPGSDTPITGTPGNESVPPQCKDRTAAQTVYCSCRCADVNGNTNDGANYCTCPDGYSCSQLVTSIGASDTGLTGAYCIKQGTAYDRGDACGTKCDPVNNKCDQ
jgi:hypothetical protein